jgi:hypothetical protein
MVKAEKSSIDNAWPVKGLPVDAAFRQLVPDLWQAYIQAPTPQSDSGEIDTSQKDAAGSALKAELHRRMENGYELWGRRGSPVAPDESIPASALRWLNFDYEEQTAAGEGEKFFDLHLRHGQVSRPPTPATASPETHSADQRLSRPKSNAYRGAQRIRARTVLKRLFPGGGYPTEAEVSSLDLWDRFCTEYDRLEAQAEPPSKFSRPSKETVLREVGRKDD